MTKNSFRALEERGISTTGSEVNEDTLLQGPLTKKPTQEPSSDMEPAQVDDHTRLVFCKFSPYLRFSHHRIELS